MGITGDSGMFICTHRVYCALILTAFINFCSVLLFMLSLCVTVVQLTLFNLSHFSIRQYELDPL